MDLTVKDAGTIEIRPSRACPVSVVPAWSSSDSSEQAEGQAPQIVQHLSATACTQEALQSLQHRDSG